MESGKKICKVCNKACDIKAERIFCMGPCHRDYHAKCVGFTPAPLKFYRESSNLFYECEDCSENPSRMIGVTLDKILSFLCILDERLSRQEAKCELICEQFEKVNDYLQKYVAESRSEITKTKMVANDDTMSTETVKTAVPDAVVLIRPKKMQKCSDTRAILGEKNISTQHAIQSVNNLRNGGVEIRCKEKNDLQKLHKKAMLELGEEYTVAMPSKRNPKIRVNNMSEKRCDDEIIESIKKQNELMKDAYVKVLHVFEVRYNETFGAIVELDPKSFNIVSTKKTVSIGSDVCNVTECVSVLRCYKCCGYNHKANTCNNRKACLRCGGEHISKDCKATKYECINCKWVAETSILGIDYDHPAWSRSCAVRLRKIDQERLRIDYVK